MFVNNPIIIFLINPNIILYHARIIKYFCIFKISLISIGLKSTEKITILFNPVFFILLIVRSYEILPKNSA